MEAEKATAARLPYVSKLNLGFFMAGVQITLMSSLKGANGETFPKTKGALLLHHDEKSLRARRRRDKGHHVSNGERIYVVTSDDGCLVPYRDRLHYDGTTRGEIIGPVLAPSYEDWEPHPCLLVPA